MKKDHRILTLLKKHYPDSKCSLNYQNPLQLLIAVQLSAQCTDEMVNKVTPKLFARFRTVNDFAEANSEELQKLIHSTGFYRNKAKNIQAACRMILEKFHGEVPQTMKEILLLPGVARKTANVVLSEAFKIAAGIPVDTHVGRLSMRLGFSREKNPEKIERDLMATFPKKEWLIFPHYLISHGRKICSARSPKCEECFLKTLCPKIGVGLNLES